MPGNDGTDRSDILSHILVPVANKEDALGTAEALDSYSPGQVTTLFVVEKGEGVPDKTPVEQSEEMAERAFAAVRTVFPDAKTKTVYSRSIVDAIFQSADEVDASAIVFRSRGGNRLLQLLSGDLALKLVTQADRPVIALPRRN